MTDHCRPAVHDAHILVRVPECSVHLPLHPASLPQIRLRWTQPRTVLLLTLLLATLVMPVNYRAGTDHEHTHTIFQGMIDAVVGHPHRHEGHEAADSATRRRLTVSPFASVAIPLSFIVDTGESGALDPPATLTPDTPTLPGLSVPISSASAIQGLRLLVAALLAGWSSRPLWNRGPLLIDWVSSEDPPPPRLA